MGISTGTQYLERLNARRMYVVVDGERLTTGVGDHPHFRGVARTVARLFDLQHDAEFVERLTVASPGADGRFATALQVPKSAADLERRRIAFDAWTEETNGFIGRTSDYLNSALAALGAATSFFAQADPVFGERMAAYVDFVREHDLFAAHTLLPPQTNRAEPNADAGDGRIAARIVEERADGIVVRGARMLATNGPIADELLVFPSTALRGAPQDAPYAYAFAIPTDTPGLKFYARAPLARGVRSADEPLASRFEEPDALVVFDDVFVPNERIFMLGHARLRNEWYSATGAAALMTHQAICRAVAKTEFFLGLASEIAEAIAIDGFPHIQEDLGELITHVEIGRAMIRAAEADGALTADGVFVPRWQTLNAARNWFPQQVAPRFAAIIRKFSASGLMALPSPDDFVDDDARSDLERYLQGARVDAERRVALFRLALDASVTGFAGRDALSELFFFGDPVRMKAALVSGYDRAPARRRVQQLLARADA